MSGNFTKLGIELDADLAAYDAAMKAAIAQATQVDTALSGIVAAASQAEGALNSITGDVSVDVKASVDTTALDPLTNLKDTTYTPLIEPDLRADDDLQKLAAIDAETLTPDITPDLNEQSASLQELDKLDNETLTPEVEPQLQDTDGTLLELDKLDKEPIEPDINPKTTDQESTETLNTLKAINAKEKFEIFMDVAGPILDVLKKLGEFTIGGITGGEQSMNTFQSQLGLTADEAERLYKVSQNIYKTGLGVDKDQVQNVIIMAQQMGILRPQLEDAATGALNITKVWKDQSPVQVLKTMNAMVESGLVPSFNEAADLIASGFQNGANKGGDFLSVMEKNSNKFKEMGLNGQQALNLIDSGLKAGFTSAGNIDNAIRSFVNKLGEAGGDSKNKTNVALKQLGLENPQATGKEVGADFLNSVIDAIKNNPGKGMSQQELAEAIFGKEAKGGAGITALLGLDTETDTFKPMVDAAATAADTIGNDLGDMLGDFQRRVEVAAQEFLSSDQIGLKQKIDDIKNAVGTAIDVLEKGGTLGQALEIGFKIQGVDTFFNNFQRIVGNLSIAFLQVVAAIQDTFGHGEEAKATRATVAKQAEGQLAFDLKLANPDEFSTIIQQATSRGVKDADIQKAIGSSVDELLKQGDIAKAMAILQSAKTQQYAINPEVNKSEAANAQQIASDAAKAANAGQLSPEQIQQQIGQGNILKLTPDIDTDALDKQVTDAAAKAQQQIQDLLKSSVMNGAGDLLSAENIAKGLGDPKALMDVFNTALKAGNLDVAGAVVQDLQGHQDELSKVFDTVMANGSLPLEQMVANSANNPDFKAAVDDYAKQLQSDFADSMKSGDAQGALDTAKLIGDPALIKEAQDKLDELKTKSSDTATSIQADNDAVKQSTQDARDTTQSSVDDMEQSYQQWSDASANAIHKNSVVPDMEDVYNTAQTTLPSVTSWVDVLTGALMHLGDATPVVQSLADSLKNLDTQAKNATSAVQGARDAAAAGIPATGDSGGDTPTKKSAGGNKLYAGETSTVGEGGTELITAGHDASILNSRTTQAIQQAIAGTAGRTMHPTHVDNRHVAVYNNYQIQNEAQADRLGYAIGREIRGT